MTDSDQDAPVPGGGLSTRVYDDLLHPSVTELGLAVHRALKIVISPANAVLWTSEQALAWLERQVTTRLSKVNHNPSSVKSPPPYLLGSCLVGTRAAGGDPTLMALFAELLTASMDPLRAHLAHPAFAEIARGLQPDDARLLRFTGNLMGGFPTHFDVGPSDPHAGVYAPFFEPILRMAGVQRVDLFGLTRSNLLRVGVVTEFSMNYISYKALLYSIDGIWPQSINEIMKQKGLSDQNIVSSESISISGFRLTEFGMHMVSTCMPGIADCQSEHCSDNPGATDR